VLRRRGCGSLQERRSIALAKPSTLSSSSTSTGESVLHTAFALTNRHTDSPRA